MTQSSTKGQANKGGYVPSSADKRQSLGSSLPQPFKTNEKSGRTGSLFDDVDDSGLLGWH